MAAPSGMPRNDRTGPVGERADVAYQPEGHIGLPVPTRTRPMPPARLPADLPGYARRNGEVGIRNELWIIPTVGCVNGVAERLSADARKKPVPKE